MKVVNAVRVVGAAVVGTALVGVTATVSFAGTEKAAAEGARTTRVSVSTAGEQANKPSVLSGDLGLVVSNGGRFVTFMSSATNLVPGDTNGEQDVFVRDLEAGTTTRVSIGAGGAQADGGPSNRTTISADGRFVAFVSFATNLVPDDTNEAADVFVRDLQAGTTTRVSIADDEEQGAARLERPHSAQPSISADGRHVTFVSSADNLVKGDTNGEEDVFVRDLDARTTTRVNVSSDGEQSRGEGFCLAHCQPRLSNSGRYVVFASSAGNLVPGDTNNDQDIFVHDVVAGTTARVNVSTESAQAHGVGWSAGDRPTITSDGRYAFFTSDAPNLVPGDTNAAPDMFRRDLVTDTTTLIKLADGQQVTGSRISADGRFVGFALARGDAFVRHVATGVSAPVSVPSDGTPSNDGSGSPLLSPDGWAAVFSSSATNLVEGDTNGLSDIFRYELGDTGPDRDTAGPTATFALDATEVSAGQSVTLDQRKLTGGTGVERVVFWGDDSAPQTLAAEATTATHVYPTAGSYRVGMVLVDRAGNRTGAGVQGSSTVSVKAPVTR